MTCTELQNQLTRQNIKKGDFVQITLNKGKIITGSIASETVSPEIVVDNETIECRIGVHEGPFTAPTTIFARDISKILKIQDAD